MTYTHFRELRDSHSAHRHQKLACAAKNKKKHVCGRQQIQEHFKDFNTQTKDGKLLNVVSTPPIRQINNLHVQRQHFK